MKARSMNLVWGLVLVVAGLVWMAQNLGWIGDFAPQVWMGVFVVFSLMFFASYFLNGVEQWGWLFPALIFGALAITVALGAAGIESALVGAPIFVAVGAPFVVAYVQDRTRWWALIPAWVMAVLVLVLLMADTVPGELIGMVVLWGIAIPFAVVYLRNRTQWWALIPAAVLGVIGLIPPLTLGFSEEAMGSVVMFLFALGFFVVYFLTPQNWWALIPAGFFASIGVTVLITGAVPEGVAGSSRFAGVIFLGWAVTFLALWLRRATAPVDWAKYPAAALGVIGLVALVLGAESLDYIWPIAIIGLGVVILWGALRTRQA
mgnify:CR=1 FL=1